MLKVPKRPKGLIFAGLGLGVIVLVLLLSGFFFIVSGNKSQQTSNVLQTGANPAISSLTAVSKENGNGTEYLALGDSIAFGVGASSPQELGYPAAFYRQYLTKARPGVTSYKNLAIPGETATSFIIRPKAKSQLDLALAELATGQKIGTPVSLVSLTIGGNDVLAARTKSQSEKETVLNNFDNNFQKILTALAPYTRDGTTQLILTTYYNPFGTGDAGLSSDDTVWMQRFNALIKQRAVEYKARVADFFPPILGQEKTLTWIGGGDIHPNTAGHAALAAALWQSTGYTLPATFSPNLDIIMNSRFLIN